MTILVGSDLPGLLSALEQRLGSAQRLTVARDAETITSLLARPDFRIDALILDDTLSPSGNASATMLWEICASMRHYRQSTAPIFLTLASDTPAAIQEGLRAEIRTTGGDVQLLAPHARTHDHPEAQHAVAWVIAQLKRTTQQRQFTIISTNNAGGAGKTSTVLNFCLQLRRLGLRVLAVDLDIAQGSLRTWLRPAEVTMPSYTTLQRDQGDADEPYPIAQVAQRVVHHGSGIDALFAGCGIRDQHDMSTANLERLTDTIARLDYDVVCYDLPGEWKARPIPVSLLMHDTASPFVICPPGRKEREGALAALEVLGKIARPGGGTALSAAMLLFIEGERGHVMPIQRVRADVLQQFPQLTDLGTLPRDPALLSMAAERAEFCSVFELAPRRPYCHAIRRAVRRWIAAVDMPAAWLTGQDPYERRAVRPFWQRHHRGDHRAGARPAPAAKGDI